MSRTDLMRTFWSALLLAMGACSGGGGDDTGSSEGDADTDTDSDTDTGHTKNDPQPVRVTGLTGDVTFRSTLDGVARCDLGMSLTLDSAAEPQSPGLLYAPVASTVVRNDGSKDCETTTLVPEDVFFALYSADASVDLGLAYTPWIWDSGDNLYAYTVADGMLVGEVLASNSKDGTPPGSLDANPNWPPETISWTRDATISIATGGADRYDDCDDTGVPDSTTDTLVGTEMLVETLHPDEGKIDVWELSLPDQGLLSLRVATDDTAIHPVLWVNDNHGCTLEEADGNVACNDKDVATSCPAVELELVGYGRQFIVRGAGAGSGSYELWYTLPAGGTLTLVEDDVEASPDSIYRITSSGSVKLTTEPK